MDALKFNRLIKKTKYDKKAIEVIYTEFCPKLKMHIGRRFGKLVSSEDVTEDVFLKLMEIETSDFIKYPTSWLFALADNYITDKLRRTHQDEEFNDTIISEKFDIEDVILNNDIKAILSNLDELSQKILYMHYWEGYSLKELAMELQLSYGSVRTRVSRAYKLLKIHL